MPYLIFLLLSICCRFISKWLWVERTSTSSHMWSIHVSWRWLLWSVCYTLPPSEPCCVGSISQPAESELFLHALSKAGLSGNLLKINRVITINKTTQAIQKFKLEFTNSQTVVTQRIFSLQDLKWLWVWNSTVLDLPALMSFCGQYFIIPGSLALLVTQPFSAIVWAWWYVPTWPKKSQSLNLIGKPLFYMLPRCQNLYLSW